MPILYIAPVWLNQFFDLPSRAIEAFLKSFAFMIVVLFAAIPWICLFLVLAWCALKFLRWWYHRRKEHLKEKNKNQGPNKPPAF
jgi:hypothetical protein